MLFVRLPCAALLTVGFLLGLSSSSTGCSKSESPLVSSPIRSDEPTDEPPGEMSPGESPGPVSPPVSAPTPASAADSASSSALNVRGEALALCSISPRTGWFRDGYCRTDEQDRGSHTVCATMTEEFLEFTKGRGNDLSTPRPEFRFPGLLPGDRWCLCSKRWMEARAHGVAPPATPQATDDAALRVVPLPFLEESRQPSSAAPP